MTEDGKSQDEGPGSSSAMAAAQEDTAAAALSNSAEGAREETKATPSQSINSVPLTRSIFCLKSKQ